MAVQPGKCLQLKSLAVSLQLIMGLMLLSPEGGACRCLLPWSDDPEDAQLENCQSRISCRIPETAAPGYYNVTVTIGDIFGSTVPWKQYFEIPGPGSSSDRSVSTFWPSLTGVPGVHMMQVSSESVHCLNTKHKHMMHEVAHRGSISVQNWCCIAIFQ